MRYWLMKSEPYKFSIDDLAALPDQTTAWDGVRNYQARNFMWKQMNVGDQAFFYHSCCAQPGITGIAEVTKPAYPDATQFDPKSRYYDSKASHDNPRWFNVEITLRQKNAFINHQRITPILGAQTHARTTDRQPFIHYPCRSG